MLRTSLLIPLTVQVDSDWGAPLMDSGTGSVDPNYDIDDGWVGNEADNSFMYFRVSLAPGSQLPSDYDTLEARLDCDQNGSYTDVVDVVVRYSLDDFLLPPEELWECQGNDPYCFFPEDNGDTYGEVILGSPNNYEWRADTAGGVGNVDWTACFGGINVQFASINSSGQQQDATLWEGFSTPNTVTMSNFASRIPLLGSAIAIVVSVVALSGLVVLQFRKKH